MIKHIGGIEYNLIDPTGNITALVTSRVEGPQRVDIATSIMRSDDTCEQVGYVENSDIADTRLCMAAGEFCGNATMSAAALFCEGLAMGPGQSRTVSVDASGCDHTVLVDITKKEDRDTYHCYSGRVHMPHPAKITRHTFEYEGREYDLPIVRFAGIDHAIAEDGLGLADEQIENAAKIWCDRLGSACFGIMTVENISGTSDVVADIRPLVFAPAVNTCYWETSCASGTSATAVWLKEDRGRDELSLTAKEPGGILAVRVTKDADIILGGNVLI